MLGAERIGDGWRIRFGGDDAGAAEAELLVVAAGLRAQAVAAGIAGLEPAAVPPLILAKGGYFAFSGRRPSRG
nr:hypothetical protein [Methylosinus sp. PW1]